MSALPVVVDSSVALKWFLPEGDAAVAKQLLCRHRDHEICLTAPTLIRLEVLNALRLRMPAPLLSDVADALQGFSLHWMELSAELAAEAASLAPTHNLTVYDATFVACALRLDADLVTDDAEILRSGACRLQRLTSQPR